MTWRKLTSYDCLLFLVETLKRSYLREIDEFQYFLEDIRVCALAFISYYELTVKQLRMVEEVIRNSIEITVIVASTIFQSIIFMMIKQDLNMY